MVVVHQPSSEPPEPAALVAARRHLEAVLDGVPVALLAVAPSEVRRLAAQAVVSAEIWQRRVVRVGERPLLDAGAEAVALRAWAAYAEAREEREVARARRHGLLARGNAFAGCCFAASAGLYLAGFEVMSAPVAAAVWAAAAGPLTASLIGARRLMVASRKVAPARESWVRSLEATGLATMGALAARRLAVLAWERRRREAQLAEQAALYRRKAWLRVAGPQVPPERPEVVIARLEQVRSAHIRLLAELLRARLESMVPAPAVTEPDGRRLLDVLERLRTRSLRLPAHTAGAKTAAG